MKYDVFIFEPILEDRKALTQLFPFKKYIVSFYDKKEQITKQISSRVPHIVVLNMDHKAENIIKLLPAETFIVGTSKDSKHPLFKKIETSGLGDMWSKPITGFKVTPQINSFIDNIEPLKLSLNTPQKVAGSVCGTIQALGESDYVIRVPFNAVIGTDLNIKSGLIQEILGEVKPGVVIKHMESGANSTDKILRITLLGLRNDDLQEIRSKILHWDKF